MAGCRANQSCGGSWRQGPLAAHMIAALRDPVRPEQTAESERDKALPLEEGAHGELQREGSPTGTGRMG